MSQSHYVSQLQAAESVLKNRFGKSVTLQFQDVIAGGIDERMFLLRCQVLKGPSGLPETLVVKRWRDRDVRLRRECASLDFLGRFDETQSVFSTLFGWDADAEIMIVEDLGDREGQWLGHILFGDDRTKAEQSVIDFQRAVGSMHAVTMGKTNVFRDVFGLYGAEQDEDDRTDKLPRKLLHLERLVHELGFVAAPGLKQDVAKAVALVEGPHPFLAFVHGDTTLANTFFTDRGIRMYDLESGGMRHCLTDGAFSRMRYLESSLAQQFPIDLRRRMMGAYREALSQECAEAMDDAVFLPAFVACCACWMGTICSDLPNYLKENVQWGYAGGRERTVITLENFAELSEEFGLFQALGETVSGMALELRSWWPEEDCSLPVYRSLRE